MRPSTTICCSALALIALASARGAEKPDAGPLALVPTRGLWTLALNNPLTAPPAYDDARAFFSIAGDRLVAYDIRSGKQLWLVESHPIAQPAAGDNLVFISESERLVALKADDGATAWALPTPEPLAVRPVWSAGLVIAIGARGTIQALRAADGHVVWTRELGVPAHAAPTAAGDRVYVPAADGRVFAIAIADGTPQWERRVGGKPSEILVLRDRLFAGSTDNFFYCVMTRDGRIDWRWRTGADVISAPVTDGSRIFFASLDNVIRAMHAVSGAQLWIKALPIRPTFGPVLAGATVLVVGQSQQVRAFNAKDGTPAPDTDAGDEIAAQPHAMTDDARGLPMVLFVTKHLIRGAAAGLYIRSIDPASTAGVSSPLPNVIKPAPMPATP